MCAIPHSETQNGKEANNQFSSVAQPCLTLCDPKNHSTPGIPVHYQLPESTQTHVHWVSDAIQPSHPLSSLLLLPSIFPSIRIFLNESGHNIKQIISLPADSLKEDTLIWIPVKIFHLEPKVKNPIWNGRGWLPSLFFLFLSFYLFSFLFVFNCLCSCFTALLKYITSGGLWKF